MVRVNVFERYNNINKIMLWPGEQELSESLAAYLVAAGKAAYVDNHVEVAPPDPEPEAEVEPDPEPARKRK